MNNIQKTLINILSPAIRGKYASPPEIGLIEWQEIYNEAEAHALIPLIYPFIKELSVTYSIPSDLLARWNQETIISAIHQTQHINQMKKVFSAFKEADIPVVALKGLILRELYPQPELRTMSDSDLLIKKEHIEVVEKILVSLGYSKFSSIENESCFTHALAPAIDLHWSLVNEDQLKNIAPFGETLWQNLRTYDFYGVDIKTLSLEYEFIHLFIHIASHMIKSGFGIRQLCDIVVFVEKNGDLLDWDLVYVLGEACKLNKLINVILTICNNLFNLIIPGTYKMDYAESSQYSQILINEIFESGVHGTRDWTRISSTKILSHSLQNSSDINKFKLIFRYLFPSIDKLDKRYSYASKYPFLLVFAWVHRLSYELFFNSINRVKELFKLKSTATLVKNRFDLIDWLQL